MEIYIQINGHILLHYLIKQKAPSRCFQTVDKVGFFQNPDFVIFFFPTLALKIVDL